MSNFIGNVLKLVSGSVAAQILGILLVPIVTRIYSPDDMGVFQLFVAVSGILVIFSTFSYQFAIMLPKSEEDSANVFFLSSILVTFISILIAVAVIIFPEDIEHIIEYIFHTKGSSKYLIYLPAIVFFNGLFFRAELLAFKKTTFWSYCRIQSVKCFIGQSASVNSFLDCIAFGSNSRLYPWIWTCRPFHAQRCKRRL